VIDSLRRSRVLRWMSPVLLVGLLFGGAWLRAADSRTAMVPPRTTAQVLSLVDHALTKPRSGTFTLSTNLGLGDIAASASGNQLVSLAGGSNLARVWSDGGANSRVALLQPLRETDWIRTNAGTWV